MLNKTPKVAIIGLGTIGSLHAKILIDGGYRLVAVCDIEPERAARAASEAGGAAIYTDYKKMLREVRPDAVHICTPHYLHAEMIIEALGMGINVLTEKPMCISEAQIKAILAAEAASSATLGVCHQNRYSPAAVALKKYADELGILSAHGTVAWHRDEAYYKEAPWRGKIDTAGGGTLINQALHTLDLLEWLSGTPTEVRASAQRLMPIPGVEVEDTVSAVFLGEHPFTLFATNTSGVNLPVHIMARLGDGRCATMTQDRLLIGDEYIDLQPKDAYIIGKPYYGMGHGRLIEDFYAALREQRRFAIDGEEGAKVIRLILEVYKNKG